MEFKNRLNPHEILGFQRFILNFYNIQGRVFGWRQDPNPYTVLISEFMLQQTQTERVEKKLPLFMKEFPTIQDLALSPLSQVLSQWVGLGYNRRAKNLHSCSKIIVEKYNGIIPYEPQILQTFPGIGAYTAGAIPAFAYNLPTIFIETNIRRVFIHHFTFPFRENDETIIQKVHDKDLIPLIEQTLDAKNPRRWYYALMDYGANLKFLVNNPNRRSTSYGKQSTFSGSFRQIRGAVVRILTQASLVPESTLRSYLIRDLKLEIDVPVIDNVVKELVSEGFVEYQIFNKDNYLRLKK